MPIEIPKKLTADEEPRVLGEDLIKNYARVTKNAIYINVVSTNYIIRTIYYTEKAKFDGAENASVHECGPEPFVLPLAENQCGSEFTFRVLARDTKIGLVTENFQFTVRAELTKAEMKAFLKNILARVSKMGPAFCYRNFTKDDVKRIMETNNGCFEMNQKLRSGHRSSPLFKKLDNVTYFSCKLFKLPIADDHLHEIYTPYLPMECKLPHFSPFGSERAAYEAYKLFNDQSVLFLAGMHCYGWKDTRPHYITVVVCQKHSLSYYNCMEMGLIELNWEDNPILQWDKRSGHLKCASELRREGVQQHPDVRPHGVWVEIILCDQSVALSDGHRSTCEFKDFSSDHRCNTVCESCHDYPPDTGKGQELKRRSLEENSNVPEKAAKENDA